ncbi:MAG: 4Fe-4S dicluster domain-containing protein [Armatimonadota bacterium]|nr:4Fe-4S dicluster domain-containing protein [Armatimonadota bacterium]
MPRWGMVIDLDKCTACQACVAACRAENNVPFAGPEEAERGRAIFWMELLTHLDGDYPNVRAQFVPRPCMHCDEPPCVQVCPVGATYKREDGLVIQDYDRCIGCRYCMVACPYGARHFNWLAPRWPTPMARALNPDTGPRRPRTGGRQGPEVRFRGVVEKCTFCIHRLEQARRRVEAEGRQLRDGDYVTACTQTCPAKAIAFGDLDDPTSEVHRLAHSRRAIRLLEELGTRPRVYYLTGG